MSAGMLRCDCGRAGTRNSRWEVVCERCRRIEERRGDNWHGVRHDQEKAQVAKYAVTYRVPTWMKGAV